MGRHAIKTPPQHVRWTEILAYWRSADRMDVFESAWTWDHFYPLAEPFGGPNLEGWTMLGALARETERLRIGSMVNGMHHRHPAVTANMAATLDHVSEGRFELGIGAGWNRMESDAYGLALGDPRTRSDRFEEGVEVIVSLLRNETTDFSGTHFRLSGARCEPKCVQSPSVPVIVGGKGRTRTLRTAARFADQWDMTFPESPAAWVELDEVLREHCAAVGRDESEITRSVHLAFDAASEPAVLAERAAGFHAAGVDVVVWSLQGPLDVARLERLAGAVS